MTVILAAAIGVLFGSGAFLLMKPDLFRIVIGVVLVANAANLTVMASGLRRGQSPVEPYEEGVAISDPLVQAMTITAIVIGFGVTALLLSLAYRVYVSSRTVDLDELSHAEARHEKELEREEISV
jgi:multicomponent Na+:H+ antiporter subunit C